VVSDVTDDVKSDVVVVIGVGGFIINARSYMVGTSYMVDEGLGAFITE